MYTLSLVETQDTHIIYTTIAVLNGIYRYLDNDVRSYADQRFFRAAPSVSLLAVPSSAAL